MRIGDLTQRAGVTPLPVRYYESRGLLPPAEREGHGHQYCTEETVLRLHRIDQLKKLGPSLEEIRDMIDLYFTNPSGIQTKQNVLAIQHKHLAETDQKIGALAQFREELEVNIERFERCLEGKDPGQVLSNHDVNVMFECQPIRRGET